MIWSSIDDVFRVPDYLNWYTSNAYLSEYTVRICLRLNLYFQRIKKLLQDKK